MSRPIGKVVGLFVLGLTLGTGCSRSVPSRTTITDPGSSRPALAAVPGVPPGFPPPLVPADNPLTAAKIELGRHLFYDERLSGNGTFSCASCHRQELAFTDGRARAVGATGELHPRGAMSLANVAYNASFAWADPLLLRLEDQARVPMFNESPIELGVAGREQEILDRFHADPTTVERFRAAFPGEADPLTMDNLVRAIASFERTLFSGNSPYDRLVYHGESDALDESARRGLRLFFSERIRCSECHAGFNFSGPVVFAGGEEIEPTFHNTGLYNLDGEGAYPPDNPGIYEKTGIAEDMGKFRAPTLRNIGVTAPYMHDGSLASLGEVIDFYEAGGRLIESGTLQGDGRSNPNKSGRVAGFELSELEERDLIAFLQSLTDRGFLKDPALADPDRPPP